MVIRLPVGDLLGFVLTPRLQSGVECCAECGLQGIQAVDYPRTRIGINLAEYDGDSGRV
jgi:hypothetical protein